MLIDGGVIKDGAVLRYMKVTHDCTDELMHHASHRMSMLDGCNTTKSLVRRHCRRMHEICLMPASWLTSAHMTLFGDLVKLKSVEYLKKQVSSIRQEYQQLMIWMRRQYGLHQEIRFSKRQGVHGSRCTQTGTITSR